MAKKKVTPATEAEIQEKARRGAIEDFNRTNMGNLWIDPDKIPTEEDIESAKKEFEDEVELVKNKKYLIADKDNAVRVATFLKNFVSKGFWTQRGFVGVINFDAYVADFLNEFEKEPKNLEMDYGPMQFAFLMLENYAGFGLDSAKEMAELWDEYVPIYDTLREHVEWFNDAQKRCELLKQKWAMFAQGYYLVILDTKTDVEENVEDHTEDNKEADLNTEETPDKQ